MNLAEMIGGVTPGGEVRLRQATVVGAPTGGTATLRFADQTAAAAITTSGIRVETGSTTADDISGVRHLAGAALAAGDAVWVLQTGGVLLIIGRVATSAAGIWTPAATKPAAPTEGDQVYETDSDILWVYDGTSWVEMGRPGAWAAYTPTLTQGVTVTKTVNYAKWTRFGRTIVAQFSMNATSTGTAGAAIEVGLPVAAADSGNRMIGTGQFYDASSNGGYKAHLFMPSTTTVRFAPSMTNSAGPLGVDAVWANAVASGDNFTGEVFYEAAASV